MPLDIIVSGKAQLSDESESGYLPILTIAVFTYDGWGGILCKITLCILGFVPGFFILQKEGRVYL